jgi:hypothetical protein
VVEGSVPNAHAPRNNRAVRFQVRPNFHNPFPSHAVPCCAVPPRLLRMPSAGRLQSGSCPRLPTGPSPLTRYTASSTTRPLYFSHWMPPFALVPTSPRDGKGQYARRRSVYCRVCVTARCQRDDQQASASLHSGRSANRQTIIK